MVCGACQKSGVAMTTASRSFSLSSISRWSSYPLTSNLNFLRVLTTLFWLYSVQTSHTARKRRPGIRSMASSSTCPWAPAPRRATLTSETSFEAAAVLALAASFGFCSYSCCLRQA